MKLKNHENIMPFLVLEETKNCSTDWYENYSKGRKTKKKNNVWGKGRCKVTRDLFSLFIGTIRVP